MHLVQKLGNNTRVYSNDPELIAANIDTAAKFVPAAGDSSRIEEFGRYLRAGGPSTLVLFDNEWRGGFIRNAELVEHLHLRDPITIKGVKIYGTE
jgi:hypothetical protein